MPRTGSDWLIDALTAEGVTHLFGNPGSTELPLIDALSRTSAVRYVLGLHEHVAMGMADGFAQVSGRLAAVNLHVQPGLANGMAGLINARRARVPILVIVGQQVSELLPGAPFLGGELVGMAAPLGVPGREVCADSLGDDLRWAVRTALSSSGSLRRRFPPHQPRCKRCSSRLPEAAAVRSSQQPVGRC